MKIRNVAVLGLLLATGAACTLSGQAQEKPASSAAAKEKEKADEKPVQKITRPDNEWKRILTPTQYYVLRQQGTERAFTGATWNNKRKGTYVCAGCGLPLFTSDTKFESGTGWPSFWQPIQKNHVHEKEDNTYGMRRVEIECARCDGHLGHVFDDGPKPTGLRYCMNSAAMKFVPAPKAQETAKNTTKDGAKKP
jgi:peptide-methionine (R)-S-oxide reductase